MRSELENIEKGIPTTERVVTKRKSITSKEITVQFSLKKILIPALVILIEVAISLVVLFKRREVDIDINRVVVAIFENQTGDANLDPIGSIPADWITQGLAQTGLVSTIPITTVKIASGNLSGSDLISGLAKETKARWVITGRLLPT